MPEDHLIWTPRKGASSEQVLDHPGTIRQAMSQRVCFKGLGLELSGVALGLWV